jgi:hypothetical protein
MNLSDLGPGFHLVAVREHCRATPKRPRPTHRDYATIDTSRAYAYIWNIRDRDQLYAELDAVIKARVDARVQRRLARERRRAERERDFLLTRYDPMAVQATMILRDVLRSIYTGEFNDA